MTESYRALIIIMGLSGIAFLFLAERVCTIITNIEYTRMRNIWFLFVMIAFISLDFWVLFVTLFIIILLMTSNRAEDRVTYYLLLLCALPNVSREIHGFGSIRYILEISYNQFLILLLFVPLLLFNKLRNLNKIASLFQLPSDLYVILFVSLGIILEFRDDTVTNAMREAFTIIVSILIPYYVISRHLNSINHFNRVFIAILIGLTPLALIGIFESLSHWHLYDDLKNTLSDSASFSKYERRAGMLRATAVFNGPIVFGYVLIIAFGVLSYLRPLLSKQNSYYLLASIILLSALFTFSRGAWFGFLVFIIVYIWTGRERIKYYFLSFMGILIIIPFLLMTSFGNKLYQLLPFIGTIRTDTVSYRQQLIHNAWLVFQRNPIFGSMTYRHTPEMESMRQGEGIIDVVNSYLHIVLSSGLVGLVLFLMVFFGLLLNTYKVIKILPHDEPDLRRLGRVLFAILTAILVTIGTVSSVDYIPIFYWAFAGITAAYIYLAKQTISRMKILPDMLQES